MPLAPSGEVVDLDPADESDPGGWRRRAQLPADFEVPEADAIEQALPVEFDEDGERR